MKINRSDVIAKTFLDFKRIEELEEKDRKQYHKVITQEYREIAANALEDAAKVLCDESIDTIKKTLYTSEDSPFNRNHNTINRQRIKELEDFAHRLRVRAARIMSGEIDL